MKAIELELKKKINLPSLKSPTAQPNLSYHHKMQTGIKYNLPIDEKVTFLTRYNKKFWESSNKENNNRSQNVALKRQKTEDKYSSQNTKKTGVLDLIEINDFDDKMKKEVENIDHWVFNNLKKMSLPVSMNKNNDNGKKTINLDIQMLNFIVQTSHRALDSTIPEAVNTRNVHKTVGNDLVNKIAITSETLNNEHNKAILIDVIRKKIINHKDYKAKDESYNMLIAKMIASDLIASFKTLSVFRHQNVLRLKEVLETITDTMHSLRMSIMDDQRSDCAEDYLYYEKTLKKHLRECEEEIRAKKDACKRLVDSIRTKKANINSDRQRLLDFAKMLEDKEVEANRNRKVGEKMKLREFMEINEYKSKKIKLEAAINQQVKASMKDIEDLNTRIEKIDKDLNEFKFKRTWFVFKLKEFYLDFFKNESELIKINKSLITMIKNVWNLNEEIFISSFSKFYEKDDVTFVLKYAKIHNEFLSMRAENNSKKQEIKNSLKKNFEDILNENEYEIISTFKESLKKFKSEGLRLYERKKVKSNKESQVIKYIELLTEKNAYELSEIAGSKLKNQLESNNPSTGLSHLSEKLSQLKEEHVGVILKRTIDKNNRSRLMGFANSEYLKKVFRLLFGFQEMQIIMQKLLKNNEIQIIPI